jgi:hypothetical protein
MCPDQIYIADETELFGDVCLQKHWLVQMKQVLNISNVTGTEYLQLCFSFSHFWLL